MKTFGCRYYDRSRSVLAIHTRQTKAFWDRERGGNFDNPYSARARVLKYILGRI